MAFTSKSHGELFGTVPSRWHQRYPWQVCEGADREPTQWHYHHFSLQVQAWLSDVEGGNKKIKVVRGFSFFKQKKSWMVKRNNPKGKKCTKKLVFKRNHSSISIFHINLNNYWDLRCFFSFLLINACGGGRRRVKRPLQVGLQVGSKPWIPVEKTARVPVGQTYFLMHVARILEFCRAAEIFSESVREGKKQAKQFVRDGFFFLQFETGS